MTRALLLSAFLFVGCTKAATPETEPPSAQVPAGTVALDADGWPVGWPETGVVIDSTDGEEGMFVPGPKADPDKAPHYKGAAVTDDMVRMSGAASRRAMRELSVHE